MEIINSNISKYKVKKNISAIKNKIHEIEKVVVRLYQEGIELYNEEDYEVALEKFTTVFNYNQGFKEVKGYFDRTTTKVQALLGM